MTDYRPASPAHEANRVRVLIVSGPTGRLQKGDTYCPAPGDIPTLLQRGLVERVVRAQPPELTRDLKSKGRASGRYATR